MRVVLPVVLLLASAAASASLGGVPEELLQEPRQLVHSEVDSYTLTFEADNLPNVAKWESNGRINKGKVLNFWNLGTGQTPTGDDKTGPSRDHTLGQTGIDTGHYMYCEASGNTDEVMTFTLTLDHVFESFGINYWYFLFGNHIGPLLFQISTDGSSFTTLKTVTGGNSGVNQQWYQAEINTDTHPALATATHFRFSTTPTGGRGDASIDDFNVLLRPTSAPTEQPSIQPTAQPTLPPTPAPSRHPTPAPTHVPSPLPTFVPTLAPSPLPTAQPTPQPTEAPTLLPTSSLLPTGTTPPPTAQPTPQPTILPTILPSPLPSMSLYPSEAPTPVPTRIPTPAPTVVCTNGTYFSHPDACVPCGLGRCLL